jgi:hypothetical protein
MNLKKTLEQRQKELQALLATSAGKNALRDLAAQYSATSDRVRPERTSVITYILVYEREHGLIDG